MGVFRILNDVIFSDCDTVFICYLSQNAKRASARKDTGLDQSLFSVQLFRLWISIIKVYKGSI